MTHFQHDLDARDRAIYFCIDALADEFDEVDLEGGDFEAFVMSRFEKYSKIDNNNESQSWSGWLQYYLASSPATPVALKPPVIIGDFMEQSGLKLHLINCIDNLYMSAFYMHIAKICQKHCDIFAMSISELEACLRAPAKEDNPHKTSKKTGILRRIFRQRSE